MISAHPTRPMRVLYVGQTLPVLSETFVYREIFALRELGLDVPVASVLPPARGLGESRLDDLAASAIVIYGPTRWAMWSGIFAEVVSHPVRATGTLLRVLSDALLSGDVTLSRRPKVIYQGLAALGLARRARGVDHIHAHLGHVPTTIAMYAAGQLGVPFSFTGHANDIFPQRTLLGEKLRRAKFVSCISHWHREFYRAITPLDDARAPIVRCGVDIPAGANPMRGGRPLRIHGIGRLIAKKGFDVLIEAIAKLRRDDIEAEIIGDGPERKALERLVLDRGLFAQVKLLGAMSNREALEHIKRADVFCLPCRVSEGDRDGIPVSLMEAMAQGTPTISGDIEAIRELIEHERGGLMVRPGDVDSLAEAIARLADDAELRRRLGDGGRARVIDEFSLMGNARRIYRALTGREAPTTSDSKEHPAPCAV